MIPPECCMCGADVGSSDESWTGLVEGLPEPVAICSEACIEQFWWVLAKGPPFGSALSEPRIRRMEGRGQQRSQRQKSA